MLLRRNIVIAWRWYSITVYTVATSIAPEADQRLKLCHPRQIPHIGGHLQRASKIAASISRHTLAERA
jgi:hypothetical protein